MRVAQFHRNPAGRGPFIQPQGPVAIDGRLCQGLRHVFWPKIAGCLLSGPLTTNSTGPRIAPGSGGLAFKPLGAYQSIRTILPPSTGWTKEILVAMTNTSTSNITRHDSAQYGSGTWDRAILRSATGFSGYIYDGAAKYCEKSLTVNAGQVYHVAVTCSASEFICYVNGEAGTTLAVSNSGFGLGAYPYIMFGGGNNCEIFFGAMWHRVLSPLEIARRAANPYSILIAAS